MKYLNLGCGSRTEIGDYWINVDRVALPGVDQVHDLDVGPWPWDTDSINYISACDVFEHVNDPILFMTECHRVLYPGASMFLQCPHYQHPDAYTDPTHKRFPTPMTWDYWIPGKVLYDKNNAAYGGVAFEVLSPPILHNGQLQIVLAKLQPR